MLPSCPSGNTDGADEGPGESRQEPRRHAPYLTAANDNTQVRPRESAAQDFDRGNHPRRGAHPTRACPDLHTPLPSGIPRICRLPLVIGASGSSWLSYAVFLPVCGPSASRRNRSDRPTTGPRRGHEKKRSDGPSWSRLERQPIHTQRSATGEHEIAATMDPIASLRYELVCLARRRGVCLQCEEACAALSATLGV